MNIPEWNIRGELALNCNCEIFCPCVVSLGDHPPTYGYCQAWLAVRIDDGHWGDTSLSGLAIAMMLDIPGRMSEGNWTVAGYIDERATGAQFAALEQIFSGRARGTTGLFRMLVGTYLGSRREQVEFHTDGDVRHVSAGKHILGAIQPIAGANPDAQVKVTNTQYWMGPDVTIAKSLKGKVRDFGRVWNLDGRSAEICQIDWRGP
ncbi:DUF1326 domain-containing protein [Tepidamorphus sp. 3E244]|uniref:DUF1326 domain-containing protein n=1 Tax=Tepidamorphus sp. 3E244 TaxID=3385498 RepID=UPI0038FCBAEE